MHALMPFDAANDSNVMQIRASSFGGLFDCALRWERIHLYGLVSPSGPRALIGSGLHAGSAAFDQAKIDGVKMTLDEAVGFAIDEIRDRCEEEPVLWTPDEPNRREVERLASRLTIGYCTEISPRYDFESVEMKAKPLDIDCGHGVTVRLTGTLDRSRSIIIPTVAGLVRRVGDVKTGKSAVSKAGVAHTKKHRPQLGTYQLLVEHTTGEPVDDTAEVIGMNTSGDFATGTGLAHGCKQLLAGSDEAPGLIELAALMFRSGLFPPNPQSALCGKKYCPHYAQCPYADH